MESKTFPWLKDLPEDEQAEFLREIKTALGQTSGSWGFRLKSLDEAVTAWQATAQAHADGLPEILATATTGDFGEVPRPEAPAPRGQGMEQGAARKRAKELGGIAVSARPRNSREGGWHLGGWPSDKDVWIVISLDGKSVLDDGSGGL